jgi:hypothetical protein
MVDGNPKAPSYPPAHLTAKNDLSELLGVLLDPPTDGSPWFASVADSGQKHVLPFAKLNYGERWNVRLEDENVHGTSAGFGAVLHVAAILYQAGFNREEIETGAPRPSKLIEAGFEFWKKHNKYINPKRGGGLLRLAVFLLRKDGIEDVIERSRGFARCLHL